MKKLLATLGMAVAAASVLPASGSLAATGDQLWANTSTNTELATNQCAGAWMVTNLSGGPFPATTNFDVIANANYSSCAIRSRVSYMKNGTQYVTSYAYAYGKNGTLQSISNAYRCRSEIGVRRNDGTWFTVKQTSGAWSQAGCK